MTRRADSERNTEAHATSTPGDARREVRAWTRLDFADSGCTAVVRTAVSSFLADVAGGARGEAMANDDLWILTTRVSGEDANAILAAVDGHHGHGAASPTPR